MLLRKAVSSYEYIDSWEKLEETSLPHEKNFYSKSNSEDISDYNYEHAKKVWDVFEIKNVWEYYDFYVHTNTLLLADVLNEINA